MSNPYNNEVIFNGQTLMSLKEDSVTPDKVLAGETFHDRSGAPQTGTLITHNVYNGLDSTSSSDALSANQGRVLNEKYNTINNNLPTQQTYSVAIGLDENEVKDLGVLNSLVPSNGKSYGAITCYSASSGNCLAMMKYEGSTLHLIAKNLASFHIDTTVYMRVLLI